MAKERGDNLEDALALAERFWDELQNVMANLKELEKHLASQEPPAVEPKGIEAQQKELAQIKKGMDSTKPSVDKCKATGVDLLSVVGDPEKPELKKHIEELKKFKSEVDPWMVKVEALNRQADDLTERTSPDQARRIKEPLAEVNRRR